MVFLCGMKILIQAMFLIGLSANAQKAINKVSVNALELNTPLIQYGGDLRLITGEEAIYQNYPNLKENVLKSIANGIQEGLYGGYEYDSIDGIRASRTTFFFYNEKLYKVRWFFLRNEHPDLEEKIDRLNTYLLDKYGPTTEEGFLTLNAWKTKKRYVQSFFDEENEFQIEYRDEKVHRIVEKLK